MDHAIVQETAPTYQDDVIEQGGGEVSKTPAFHKMEKMKERKYRPLLPVAKHLTRVHALDFQPFFYFPVVSSLGYLNSDAELKLSGPREDGIPLGIVKSRYRTQISNALCFGILRGKALALNSQGRAEAFRS